MKVKQFTLCVLHDGDNNRVLLGMKKRGLGEGKWNGFGGKVEEGEGVEEAAIREMREEIEVEVKEIDKRAVMLFYRQGREEVVEVHLFSVVSHEGEPVETEEMRPEWFGVDEIPFNEMWPDDEHWFPLFLSGKKFKGEFWFDEEEKGLLKHELTETESW